MDSGKYTKSLRLSKQDVNMLKKKRDYPCKWRYRGGNMRSEFIKVGLRAADWKLEWQRTCVFFSWILPGMEQGNKMAGVAGSICFLLIQTAAALHLVYRGGGICAVSEMFTITGEVLYFPLLNLKDQIVFCTIRFMLNILSPFFFLTKEMPMFPPFD